MKTVRIELLSVRNRFSVNFVIFKCSADKYANARSLKAWINSIQ